MSERRVKIGHFNLITGQDTFASQTAQNPSTSRKVKALIPSASGDLTREARLAKLWGDAINALPSAVVFLHQFDRHNHAGTFTSHFFAATSTALYKFTSGAWNVVSQVGTLTRIPVARNANNVMHFDGGVPYIYDGSGWYRDGLDIPFDTPEHDYKYFFPSALDAGIPNWTNLPSFFNEDNNFAGYAAATQDEAELWNFKIPVDSTETIRGIEVLISGYGVSSTGTDRDIDVALSKNANTAAVAGTRKLNNRLNQTTKANLVLGGPTDLWGTTWTPTEISDTNFGVLIRRSTAAAAQIYIDSVRIRVYIADTSNGQMNITINRYYWFTYGHETSGASNFPERVHESTSSPRSQGTGVITNGAVRLKLFPGVITASSASTGITGVGTNFNARHVGMRIYADATLLGVISQVLSATSLTLTANSTATVTNRAFTIAPVRADRLRIYASEAENSNVGFLLVDAAITTAIYTDYSPFANTEGSIFQNVERPTRNDPCDSSRLLEVFKKRFWRRKEDYPAYFYCSGQEEIGTGGDSASPFEAYPGISSYTLSDISNLNSYPDESDEIRGFFVHGDTLFIFTEDEGMPLYGEDRESFELSQLYAFKVGIAGRFAGCSTHYGLAFVSYDKRLYLYPNLGAPAAGIDSTSFLLEIGLAIRNELDTIKAGELDNVRLHYHDSTDTLHLTFKNASDVWKSYAYDFQIQGWRELQSGFVCFETFEYEIGKRALVAGGSDGYVYVLDDPAGTYIGSGNFPEGVFRPALIDFGKPDEAHIVRYIEYEADDATLSVTVNYWLDPTDVDDPDNTSVIKGQVTMTKLDKSNIWRGFINQVCARLLIELKVDASAVDGSLRSFIIAAEPVSRLALR